MALGQGKANMSASFTETKKSVDPDFREALNRAEAWRVAANRLANLHPHEWTVLYAAALEEVGLTD
jgi:hypothetical protein